MAFVGQSEILCPSRPKSSASPCRHFAAGVTITTIRAGDRIHGLTVSAFASVSAAPPLDRGRHRQPAPRQGAVRGGGGGLRRQHPAPGPERSCPTASPGSRTRTASPRATGTTAETGAPILADALAWLDCRIHSRAPAGTHTIYVGEVQASSVPGARSRRPGLLEPRLSQAPPERGGGDRRLGGRRRSGAARGRRDAGAEAGAAGREQQEPAKGRRKKD